LNKILREKKIHLAFSMKAVVRALITGNNCAVFSENMPGERNLLIRAEEKITLLKADVKVHWEQPYFLEVENI
jgi:hypothetical protein